MDFLSKAYEQLAETLRPMSLSTKIIAVLLLAAIVVSVVFLFQFNSNSADEYLLGGHVFTVDEERAALAAFTDADLNNYQLDNHRIRVPRSQRYKYIDAMAKANALPESSTDLWEKLFSTDVLASRETRQSKERYRKKRELEKVLTSRKDITQAKVEFHSEPGRGLVGAVQKSALVTVTPSGTRPLPLPQIKSVQAAAAAYLGMRSQDVAIMDTANGQTYRSDADGLGVLDDSYSSHKTVRESLLRRKIENQLSHIDGVKVDVNIDVDWEKKHDSRSVKFNEKPTAVESSTKTEELQTSAPQPAGPPGVQANNAATNTGATVAAAPSTTKNISREDQKMVVGQEVISKSYYPYRTKDVHVSIGIPDTYFVNVWQQKNPVKDGQQAQPPTPVQLTAIREAERQKIEELVNNLLPPVDDGENPFPRVVVRPYPVIPVTPLAAPGIVSHMTDWLQDNWKTLGMAIMGLVGLVILRGMVRSAQPEAGAAAPLTLNISEPSGEPDADDEEDEDEEEQLSLKDRFQQTGPNLRDELTEMVKEDPDAAATVLSAWIGD